MQHIENTGLPTGSVVIATGFQARWHEFYMALESLQVPAGTRLLLNRSCDIAHNFNQGVRKMEGSWCWFMGDDHTFAPDILLNLLKRDLPVVQPLVIAKIAPFRPCIMHGPYKVGMPVYRWDELPTSGLWPLPQGDFVGQAGMLVQKDVLIGMGDPWFEPGKLERDRLQEDLYFCHKLQSMGYTIWQDCEQVLGHLGNVEAYPIKTDQGWVPGILSGARRLALPSLVPERADAVSPMPDHNPSNRPSLKWVEAEHAEHQAADNHP